MYAKGHRGTTINGRMLAVFRFALIVMATTQPRTHAFLLDLGIGGHWGRLAKPSVSSAHHGGVSFYGRSGSNSQGPLVAAAAAASYNYKEDEEDEQPHGLDKPATSDIDEFVDYMFRELDCQGEPGCVEVGRCPTTGRRGLFVALEEGISEGDYVFAVPADSTWVVETPATDEFQDADRGLMFWQQQQRDEDEDEDEDDEDSDDGEIDWRPYLNVLPSPEDGFDPTPDFWYEYEIRALELPVAVDRALTRKWKVKDLASRVRIGDDDDLASFLSITGEGEGVGVISADELRFATWLVNSRAVAVVLGDDEEEEEVDPDSTAVVLVPLLDMINHSSDVPNAYFAVLGEGEDDENDEDDTIYYAVVAARDLSKGEELLISYGTEEDSSVDLLLHYGFVPETNPFDVDFWETICNDGDEEVDSSLESMSFWTTTLQEDEDRLAVLENEQDDTYDYVEDPERRVVERMILRFRIRMKRSYADWRDRSSED